MAGPGAAISSLVVVGSWLRCPVVAQLVTVTDLMTLSVPTELVTVSFTL